MSTERYLWRVYCVTEGQYVTTISSTVPTECPNDSGHTIDSSQTAVMSSLFIDIVSEGYVNIESLLSDNQAIKINASDTNGGIDIDAGIGGITVDTSNGISLDGGAACNFTATNGNLELRATAGLVNIDGGSGINIGSLAEAQPINIGTLAAARNITLGNSTGTSLTQIITGTGGFIVDTTDGGPISLDATGAASNFTLTTNGDAQDLTFALLGSTDSSIILTSAGTGADAIRFDTSGGIDADATGTINFASGSSAGGAITLDAAFNNGGINISAGSQGIAINSTSALVGINHWSGGDLLLGTSAIARTITIGSSTTTTKLITRFGTGGLIKSQPSPVSLSDASQTVTIANLLTGLLTMTPTTNRTVTLPTAANVVGGISGVEVGDCIDFATTNQSSVDNIITIAMGTSGTSVGNMDVYSTSDTGGNYFTSAAGMFRLRLTNVTASSEAYTVYRIC